MDLTNPIKAIRAKCLDCCCNQQNEVKLCTCTDCPLYPFRFGKNPYKAKRNLTPEQLVAKRERMQQINLAKMHDKQMRENRGTPRE